MTVTLKDSQEDRGQRYEVQYLNLTTAENVVYGYTEDPNGGSLMNEIAQTSGMGYPRVRDRRSPEISARLDAQRKAMEAGNVGALSNGREPISEEHINAMDCYLPPLSATRNREIAAYLLRLAAELTAPSPRVHLVVEQVPNLSSPITLLHVTRRGTPGISMTVPELFTP